jgi:GntR family transcriptional regulator
MEELPLNRQEPLADQLAKILADRIRDHDTPGRQLPSEAELGAELGVSRATVRDALGKLADRGLVVRRQGIGTFVSQLSSIRNPLNEFIAFPELIADNGFEPGFLQIGASEIDADAELASMLRIDIGSKVLEIQKVFTADGEPVIYCVNHIPAWVYQSRVSPEEALQPGMTQPILGFLEDRCGQRVEYYTASVRADLVKNVDIPDALSYDPETPVLLIDEIGHNSAEDPVHRSLEHHCGNRMTFQLVRRRGLLRS